MRSVSLICIVILISCNPATQSNSARNIDASKEPHNDISGCYESIYGKDTISLQLTRIIGDTINGRLNIHYTGKDRSAGDFAGKVENQKLIGWYRFQSEGKSSVRQVIFKISGDSLTEGYGDIRMLHDSVAFRNTEELNYLSQRPLVRTGCP